MISRLRGTVREIRELQLLLDVNGIGYDVFIPSSIHRLVPERISDQGELELVTFHYQQLEVGRGVPVLIGFFNEVEREFFVRFISVAGIGPDSDATASVEAGVFRSGSAGVLKLKMPIYHSVETAS